MKITIPGIPIAMQRPRVFILAGRSKVYNPQLAKKKKVMATITQTGVRKLIGRQAIHVQLVFYMPIPKSYARHIKPGRMHNKKPDIDNMIKFILDCMNGIAYEDDAQICKISALKIYSHQPRTEITILCDQLDLFDQSGTVDTSISAIGNGI